MRTPDAILIVKLSSIGDVVISSHTAEAIRKTYPNAFLAWVVEDKSKDAVIGNPNIDKVIVWDRRGGLSGLRDIPRLCGELRSHHFDWALDMQGLVRSALITYLSGASTRVGYARGTEYARAFYNKRIECELPHSTNCQRLLMEAIGVDEAAMSSPMLFPLSDQELRQADELLASVGISEGEGIAAMVPATTRAPKHWVESRWAELADEISSKRGLVPVFLGAGGDRELVERIRSQANRPTVSLAGKTTLKAAGAVLKRAKLAVAVDTGLLHISVAVGTRTVGIFGPTSAWRNHIERPNFRVVMKDLPCAPCRSRADCAQFDCMLAVTVDDVAQAASEMFSTPITAMDGSASCP